MNLDSIIFSFLLIRVFIRPTFIGAQDAVGFILDPKTSLRLIQPSTASLRPKPKIITDELEVKELYKKLRKKYLQNQDWKYGEKIARRGHEPPLCTVGKTWRRCRRILEVLELEINWDPLRVVNTLNCEIMAFQLDGQEVAEQMLPCYYVGKLKNKKKEKKEAKKKKKEEIAKKKAKSSSCPGTDVKDEKSLDSHAEAEEEETRVPEPDQNEEESPGSIAEGEKEKHFEEDKHGKLSDPSEASKNVIYVAYGKKTSFFPLFTVFTFIMTDKGLVFDRAITRLWMNSSLLRNN